MSNGYAWTFTDPSEQQVISHDQHYVMLVSSPEIQEYLAGGGVIGPFPSPTPQQAATLALSGGITITSTGTPAVTGTYSLDAATQSKIMGIAVYIGIHGAFPPGGASTIAFPDIHGAAHIFPSTTVFLAWATAMADCVTALDAVTAGITPDLPAMTVTIA